MVKILENGLRIDGQRLQESEINTGFGRVNLYDGDGNLIGHFNGLMDVDYDVELTEEETNQIVDLWNSISEASFTIKIDKIQLLKIRIRTLWWIFINKIHKIFKR